MATAVSLYGLGVSVNRNLGALVNLPGVEAVDVYVEIGPLPQEVAASVDAAAPPYHVSADTDSGGISQLRISQLGGSVGGICMAYGDGALFVISEDATRVWATTPDTRSDEDTAAYLLGPIMGTVLRMRGNVCLHASAVAIAGRAIALAGPSGAGKSTTAAAFARLGYPVLSDDVVALTESNGRFLARPAYPRVRLWPEAVAGLFGSADSLPLLTPNWDKRFLGLDNPTHRFQDEPLELSALYFLEDRTGRRDQPSVASMKPTDALLALVSDSYAANALHKPFRAREFDVLGRLVENVRVRRATAKNDLSCVDDFCETIVEDFLSTQSPSVGAAV